MQKYTKNLYIVYIAQQHTFPPTVFVHLDKSRREIGE